MSEITLRAIYRSRFLERREWEIPGEHGGYGSWMAKPGMDELMNKFRRNKVIIQFKTTGLVDSRGFSEVEDYRRLREMVRRVCDKIATGYWTSDENYTRESHWDPVTNRYGVTGEGEGHLELNFENEADLDTFMTKEALIIKLSH